LADSKYFENHPSHLFILMLLVAGSVALELYLRWRKSDRPLVGQTGILVSDVDVGEKAKVRFDRPSFGGISESECIGLEAIPQGAHVKVITFISDTPLVKKAEVTPPPGP
jgi:hypothetical protein